MANKRIRMNISFSEKEADLFDYIMSKKNSSQFLKLLARQYWEEELKKEKGEQSAEEKGEDRLLFNKIIQKLDELNLEILNLKGNEIPKKHEQYTYNNDDMLMELEL